MTDGTMTIETPTPTMETPLANSQEARTETGEIIDRSKPAESVGDKPTTAESKPESVGAPEAYSDFSIPEGHTLDAATIESATPIFRELGLSQDQAQKLVDFYSARVADMAKETEGYMEQVRTEWRTQLSADKEIGGKLGSVKVDIGRALDRLPTEVRDNFKAAMDLTGAGDNPAIVKAMYSLAQLVNEGTPVRGDNPSPHGQSRTGVETRPSAAAAMYPNLPKR